MSPSVVPTRDDLVARLRARFAGIPAEHVRRCVDDLWRCCTHLGMRPDARTIERLAASRLTGVVRGARPPRPDGERAPGPHGPAAAALPSAPPTTAVPPGTAGPRTARAAASTPIGM
ncbi:hypothetical protein [Actinomadura opuntiae]|uniref:hypothetical protein n=1 Tax=Actinomadura sp. OS1-43 TaxID=604315 RepID=UPI00255B0100|nr:hypothetical protein [Actinomadura sp. OS1-43]MDL4817594.1 hypothetical protein [Actinomadura sp. OS1-43]